MTVNCLKKVLSGGVVLTTFVSCSSTLEIQEKPNILFITTDYTRGEDLPVTGAPFLNAPVLKRLCNEGVVFTHHCCNAPISMPARASITTGHYPHSHSLWDNARIPVRQENLPFLITDLKECGYQTLGIGKMHFHPFEVDDNYDYDVRVTLEGKDALYRNDDYECYLNEKGLSRKDIRALSDGNDIPRGQSFFDWPLDESLHADAFVGIKTLEVIRCRNLSGQSPWFMWVSFTGPHNPWNAPARLTQPYRDMKDLPTGDFVEGELESKPLDYTRHRYGYGGDLMNLYDEASVDRKEDIRKSVRAGHYGSLSFIDEWIGKIMDELEKKGQLDNTIIVFTSDHGSALFDNEMLHKGSPYPTQSIVPFVVWYPKAFKARMCDALTSHVDLYATFLELAGHQSPGKNEGKSLVPLLNGEKKKVNDFVVIESALVTSVMDHCWLAGFHPITKERELYDLKNDPMCHINIADQKRGNEILKKIAERLVGWRRKLSSDPKQIKEDPLDWREELGDVKHINLLWERNVRSYRELCKMPSNRPGVTGKETVEILRNVGLE